MRKQPRPLFEIAEMECRLALLRSLISFLLYVLNVKVRKEQNNQVTYMKSHSEIKTKGAVPIFCP